MFGRVQVEIHCSTWRECFDPTSFLRACGPRCEAFTQAPPEGGRPENAMERWEGCRSLVWWVQPMSQTIVDLSS